jgi:hypothetical protein
MMTQTDLQGAAAAVSASSAAVGLSLSGISVEWLGVPLPVLLLGLSGAMSALSFLPAMQLAKMVCAVVIGTLAAAAATPMAAHMLGLPSGLHLGVAFFAGLFAHLMMTWAFQQLPKIVENKFGIGSRRDGDS